MAFLVPFEYRARYQMKSVTDSNRNAVTAADVIIQFAEKIGAECMEPLPGMATDMQACVNEWSMSPPVKR